MVGPRVLRNSFHAVYYTCWAGGRGGGTHNFHSQVIRIVYELELIIAPKRGGWGSASRPLPLVIQREYVHSYNMIQQSV